MTLRVDGRPDGQKPAGGFRPDRVWRPSAGAARGSGLPHVGPVLLALLVVALLTLGLHVLFH